MRYLPLWLIVVNLFTSSNVHADTGHPVAVRWWGQAMVSIETYWNFTIVIDPDGGQKHVNPNLSADLVLVTHERGDQNDIELIQGKPIVARGLDEAGKVSQIDQILDRFPGQDEVTWRDARLRIARSQHAVRVTSVASWQDDAEGSQHGANAMFVIEVDGVRIVHCGGLGQSQLTDEQLKALGQVDVLLVPVGGIETVSESQSANIVRKVNPRIVVPIHRKTPDLAYNGQATESFLQALGEDHEVQRANGNTLAVTANERDAAKPHVVALKFRPWEMSDELAFLFAAKEAACRASQQVFAKLSAEQMNFKPSNGTHTPRWNTEHMMGRELGFFSQIYAELDSNIKHLDLNPKQMPPDYEAAHPDWSGAEEARQMERVSAFTRRFAYLLDGLPLDEKAPGSFWTPRKLLMQMDRHYGEHTANVQKKFELPDWPQNSD